MRTHYAEALKKTVASTVAASLLLVAPGTPAIAQQFRTSAAPTRVAPVAPVAPGAMTAPLAAPSLSLPGSALPVLPTAMPAAPSAIPYKVPAAAAAQAAPAPAAQAVTGRMAAPIAAAKEAPGLMGVLSHQVRGQEGEKAPEAAGWLAPAPEAQASASSSRDWAGNSFEALLGRKAGATQAAAEVSGREAYRPNLLARPSLSANGAKPGLPLPGKSKVLTVAKFAIPAAIGLTGLAMYMAWIPAFGLAPMFLAIDNISLGWQGMLALNIGIGVAVQVGKMIFKARKEKKAKAAEKAAAAEKAKDLAPMALEGAAAAEAVEKRLGTNEGVSVYDYSTGQMHVIPVDAELVEAVKKGSYKVTTDSSGALYLVPVLASEPANGVKDEEKKAEEAPAPKAEAPAPSPAPAAPQAEEAAPAPKADASPKPASRNPSGKAGASPKSFTALPKEAAGFDAKALAEGKEKAQARARKLAPDARLVRVTLNLDDPRAHPVYVFHSKKKGQVLTVWQKRVGVRKDKAARQGASGNIATSDALWDTRLAGVRSLEDAYAAMKAEAHWFKPVRVELVARWKAAPDYVFVDAKGREMRVSAAAAAPAPTPEPAPPPASDDAPAPVPPAEKSPNLPPPAERGPPPEAPPPAKPEGGPTASLPTPTGPHIHEDLFGFRTVRGVSHGDAIRNISIRAGAREVIDAISAQFGISRDKVVAMGKRFGLHESSERESWLAVYDRLQAANRAEFEHLDQKKYHGGLLTEAFAALGKAVGLGSKKAEPASFRTLANKTYPAGLKGWAMRALELHKHAVGLVIRLPLHLFDSFLFGYFRRAIAYEFFRGREDFFSVRQALDIEKAKRNGTYTSDMAKLPPLSERMLESAMQSQYMGGTTAWHRFSARPAVRFVKRWFVTPFAAPLVQFTWRRASLAVFSAAAMGFVSGVVPLGVLGLHMTGLPVLGPALAWLAHGLPAAAAGVPVVGEGVSAVLGHAMSVLVDDLTVGNVLNTFTLSTALTFPAAVKTRLMEDRGEGRLTTPRLRERAFWYGVVGTFFSLRFWLDNLKSFFGLLTVGAEIEAVMGYAGGLDAAVTPAFKAVTGHEFKLFHTVAAAVERPQGDSPIPFGGAITWGNVLIYKLQNLIGFNLTDETYRLTHGLLYADNSDAASQALLASAPQGAPLPAGAAYAPGHELPGGAGAGGAPGGASVVAAVVGTLARAGAGTDSKGREPGDIRSEIERSRQAVAALESRISGRESRLDDLSRQSKPVTEAEEREYQETLRLLAERTDRSYVQSKLSQIHDLRNPQDSAAALKSLEELGEYYRSLLPEEGAATGYAESLGVRMAVIKSVQQAYADFQNGAGAEPRARALTPVDREATARIEPLVAELEKLRGEAKGELANRDALERLLSTVGRARNLALQERRGGKDMLEFHKNMARLATVMDLAFSLNTIEASQKAILDMQKMLDDKLEKIRRASEQADRDRAATEANQAKLDQWKREIDAKVSDDQASITDMADLEEQTRSAVENITAFRSDLRSLLARIDAEDAGSSPNARAEYARRQALLPQIAQWNTDGKPGDPNYTNLKELRQKLVDIDDYIAKVSDGLSRIDGAPAEFAGVLVVAVPGVPSVTANNPSAAQTLQILADRRAYWEAELASYTQKRDDFRHRLDASFTGTETDEFGEVHPYSLPRRLAEAQSTVSRRSAEARDLAARIDAAVSDIRAVVPGADLPALTGLGLDAYQTAIEQYPDKLQAVVIPSKDSPENMRARMALLKIGRMISPAGHAVIEWSKADATITAIQEAMSSPVPQVAALYGDVVAAVQRIISDVDADVAYVNAGFPAGQNQGLIDRKRALLQGLEPMLRQARTAIADNAIPFQEKGIRSYDPNGDKYAKLFRGQVRLYDGTKDAVEKTLPWALASNGAKEGDTAGGLQNIESRRQRFRELLAGYDDAKGHHKGVDEHLAEIAKREDPNNSETEDVYGQTLPVSLPRLIDQFTAEKAQRSGDMNRQNAEVNAILDRIEQMTGGKFGLASRKLPTGLGTDQASVDRVQALVDARALQNLGDLLTQIGTEYKAKAGSVGLGGGGGGTVPSGTQPSPTVDDATQIALLSLEAAKRLVPSTADPQTAPAAYAVARFLYSDAVVSAAKENLYDRIPRAKVFLNQAKGALNDAIGDLDRDVAYVQANGGGEAADSVIDRKVRVFGALNAVTRAGVEFYGLKKTWDQGSYDTLGRMDTYYGSTHDIYANSGTVTANEADAIRKMKDALQKTFDDLEVQRQKLTRWMGQLNSPDESALKRVAGDLRAIQEKTRAVLEQNFQFRDVEERFKRSEDILGWTLGRIDKTQTRLSAELRALRDPAVLDPSLRRRIEALRFEGQSWALGGDTADATAALVIPKRDFSRFIDTVFSALLTRVSSTRDLSGLKRQLLENPGSLSDVLPNAQVAEFGDADGFYMVYQSQFSVPHGLETSNWVTLGNVARLWGNNVSVTGYQFASPPNDENAPWGDKGVEVQVESIQGKNWVNYLSVDFHRFIQDIPPDTRMASTASQSRIMVFEDFAVLLFGDKLYVAFTGFGDAATTDSRNKPYFYGGSFKTSLKFTEVMKLNAEQQQVFAKDPRYFLETVNLDFTGLDPDLNRNFVIDSHGENKHYTRTQVGPSFDIARLMDSQDAFTVDLFWAKQSGTDDYDQQSLGVSVLKGFTIRDSQGKPWMVINNRAGAEVGQKQNIYSDRVSVTLPNWGVAVSAEGRLIGDAKTYYLQAGKKLGDNSEVSVGYGTKYPGMPERLTLALNTSFTLGQLWSAVAKGTADELQGGGALKGFDAALDGFYGANEDDAHVKDLKATFQRDVASRLVRQDMGRLVKDIQELRRAGAIMDNTRVRGMVGFVSNPVGEGVADRAVGGGFTAGTQTTLTLNKTQKALLENKVQSLYEEGLRLQGRMMDLTKQWQETLVEAAEAQWELKMAKAMAEGAPEEALRREGEARVAAAELRLRQAAVRYNALVGRPETEGLPFEQLSAADIQAVMNEIRAIMAAQDPLVEILKGLDPDAMKEAVGDDPFNLMDWIPWVEQLTFSFGTQYQDSLANQVLGLGGSVRLPVYDPASKERDKAYRLETEAVMARMLATWESYSSRAESERLAARGWNAGAGLLRERADLSARALADAVRGYRNGLVPESRVREAYEQWRFYAGGVMTASARAALAQGWAGLDGAFGRPRPDQRPAARVDTIQDAFDQAASSSRGLSELEARRQAAEHMTAANANRIQKLYADIMIGYNITASGVGWLPSFGLTGMAITPVITFDLKTDELRDLQVRQGEGQEAYYRQAKIKLEADLALEFFNQTVAWTQAGRQASVLEGELLPRLEAALSRARSSGGDPAAREQAVAKAQRDLDGARRRLQLAVQSREQARAAINHILGRAPEAALDLGLSPEKALADLKQILAAKDAVSADRGVLDARVEVARAVETMADKDLKLEQLRLEPVSLVVRSLGRLARALSDDSVGNPDLVAAARVQTLEAERARTAYDEDLPVRRAQAQAELDSVRSRLSEALGRGDAQGRLDAADLEGRAMLLEAALARLGAGAAERPTGAVPSSFAELADRAADAEQSLAYSGRDAKVEAFDPEVLTQRSLMGARFFRAWTDLGKNPIDRDYLETWVEFRLRSQQTPAEVLEALARLRTDKATRVHANDAASARARGQVLVSEFETTVRLKRWLDSQTSAPSSQGARRDLSAFQREVEGRLTVQAGRLKALLGLPAATPDAELVRLVPGDPDGRTGDVTSLAKRMLEDVSRLEVARVRQTVFDGGIPESFGNEDSLINQIRADVIADRMSYKGFTPVAAFGVFRGKTVWGGYLEAPDPRSIESALQRVLSDSVRKELESEGRMRELALGLHLLMARVEGGAKLAERQAALVTAAQADYQAVASRVDSGLAGEAELFAAQDALVRASIELSSTLASLKSDFITLVSELEALGYDNRKLLSAGAAPMLPAEPAKASPASLLAGYASKRSLDAGFASRLEAALASLPGAGPQAAAAYAEEARWYRSMSEDAGLVRRNPDFSSEERLELLTKADVEGRRLRVEAVLTQVLAGVSNDAAAKQAVLAVIGDDLAAGAADAGARVDGQRSLESRVREAMLDQRELPAALRGVVDRVETARAAMSRARQDLREEALKDRRSPTEFLLTDQALDRYLKAVTAYDAAVAGLYGEEAVKADAGLAGFLDSLYPLRASLARGRDLARSGRGMLALDALIGLADDRLAALRYERAAPSEVDAALAAKRRLTELAEAWRARDPRGLEPLVALTKAGSQGRRVWDAADWMTEAELQRLYSGRIETGTDGRRFVTARDGARYEVIGGVDAAEAALARARGARDANESRRRLYDTLRSSEFALLSFDGSAVQGLSYADLSAKARAGQTFVFSAEADARGLRPAVHPLKALWAGPAAVETIVYTGTQKLSRDRFPTYESLREYVDGLRLAKDPEAANFLRVEAGPQGLARLMENAKEMRVRSERAGWLGVKLQSYGVAVDASGRPRELFLTQEEFDAAMKALNASSGILAEARAEVSKARALRDAARAERDAQRPKTDAESAAFQSVEREARERLKDQVAAKTPRREGEAAPAYALRLKAAQDEAVAKDSAVKSAQDRLSKQVEAQNKLEQKASDAERAFDKSIDGLRRALVLAAHAGQWESARAEALPELLKAMEDAGARPDERDAAASALGKEGARRMLVTRDVIMHVDAANRLARVTGTPVFGGPSFSADLGVADGATRAVGGELFAAVADVDGRLVKLYMDPDVVAAAGKGWTLVGVDGKETPVADRAANPAMRVMHYADPATALKDAAGRPVPGSSLPVMLNRRYMIELLTDSGRAKSDAAVWAYGPWNWGNIIWEIPKGVLGTPLEIVTGRDPNQNGYLGRVNMYKTEGGATEHQGFFRKVLGVLDILDLMPEKVDWYFDPTMFPEQVTLDSPLLPGENLQAKDMRSGNKDVHFGRGAYDRIIRAQAEDIVNGNRRVLSHFEGGVQQTMLEERRGRAPGRTYLTSRVGGQLGAEAVDRALDDAAVGADDRSLRPGEGPVSLSGRPGHIEVDRVERRIEVTPGAENYGRVTDHLSGLPEVVAGRAAAAEGRAPGLETAARDAGVEFDARTADLALARREEDAARARAREQGARIAAQRAIEGEMSRIRAELGELRDALARERRRLAELEDELRRGPGRPGTPSDPSDPSNPGDPGSPTTPNPVHHLPVWVWAVGLAFAAAVLAYLLHLRRRRP